MPPITRWHVKLALVYLVAALALGIAQAAGPETWAALFAVYVHLLVVGWITQMIFGVAYWMFPKFSKERPRGSNRLAVAAFVLLNLGLVIRAVAEPLQFRDPAPSLGWLLAVSAAAQWLAGMAFIANMWPRVKER